MLLRLLRLQRFPYLAMSLYKAERVSPEKTILLFVGTFEDQQDIIWRLMNMNTF